MESRNPQTDAMSFYLSAVKYFTYCPLVATQWKPPYKPKRHRNRVRAFGHITQQLVLWLRISALGCCVDESEMQEQECWVWTVKPQFQHAPAFNFSGAWGGCLASGVCSSVGNVCAHACKGCLKVFVHCEWSMTCLPLHFYCDGCDYLVTLGTLYACMKSLSRQLEKGAVNVPQTHVIRLEPPVTR